MEDIQYLSEGPLFSNSNYSVGDIVIWIDGEDVYEGEIVSLYNLHARVVNIKKLMPVNHVANVSYWKISESRKSNKESSTKSSCNIIGDDLY